MRVKYQASFVVISVLLTNFSLGQWNNQANANKHSLEQRKKAWSAKLQQMPISFDSLWTSRPLTLIDDSLTSTSHSNIEIQTHVIFDPKIRRQLKFRFLRNSRMILELKGHRYSSFIIGNNLLFFAEYFPFAPGCEIVAYELQSGREAWRTQLRQQQPKGASGYRNRVRMHLLTDYLLPGEKSAGGGATLQITGSESYCDYVEVLDAKTGISLAINNFRIGFESPKQGK